MDNTFLDTLKQLGPSRLGIMAAILVGLLMFFIFVSLRVSTPEMKLLYADLSTADSGAIAAKLEETDIDYKVSADGTRIVVSETSVGRARLLLAEAGLLAAAPAQAMLQSEHCTPLRLAPECATS